MNLNGLLDLLQTAERCGLEKLAASTIILVLESELIDGKEKWFQTTMGKPQFRDLYVTTLSKIQGLLRDFDKGFWDSGSSDLKELATFTAQIFRLTNS